jgi:hypothetical protein
MNQLILARTVALVYKDIEARVLDRIDLIKSTESESQRVLKLQFRATRSPYLVLSGKPIPDGPR